MIGLKIGIPDQPAMNRTFQILREWVTDLESIWRNVAHPYILQHAHRQFDTAGSYGGQPWASYGTEPSYAAWKFSIVGHLRPLVWDWGGEFELLRPSLSNAQHPMHIFEADDTRMSVGTSLEYAEDLNTGGIGPFGEPYPARKMFAMTEGHRKELVTLIQREMMKNIPPEVRQFMRVER